LNNDGEKMQRRDDGGFPNEQTELQIINNSALSKEMGYDGCKNENAIESTVIWIGKDSESESDQYLEECNTHQSGE
jgi:hypothetical protein